MKHVAMIVGAIVALVALSLPGHAAAAGVSVYCVSSAGGLVNAFASANAGDEGTTQDIRIVRNSYTITSDLLFDPDGSKDNKTFRLSGGWSPGCPDDGSRVINPTNTVLDLSNHEVSFFGDNARYTVEGIRFDYATKFLIGDGDCTTLFICPDTEAITVRYNEFRHGNLFGIDAFDARTLTLSNNLFDHFSGSFDGLVYVSYFNNETAPDISFNTFGAMHCNGGGSLLEYYSEKDGGVLHHNIFDQTGCDADVHISHTFNGLSSGQTVALRSNLYRSLSGLAPSANTDPLINVDPGFIDPANYNFNLRATAPKSPAIDAGMTLPELVLSYLAFPAQDLDGPNAGRLIGSNFDLGALESAGPPPPTEFVVKNTNDSGPDSLRDAIDKANMAIGFQRITFAIPGTCPRKISLASQLPDITDDVEIDGYSQPGSQKNTAVIGSNANLCVEVGPPSGSTLSNALRVPDAAPAATNLTLRGIAFTGGHSLALNLRGGSGHIIQGNAFGGVRPTSYEQLGDTNISHLAVRGVAQGALIGGSDPEDRNYFGTSQLNAILLLDATSGGHTVQNNYIGLDPGGAIPQPLGGNGISAQDSPNNQILGNIIDGADSAIRISGASAKGYVIKGNTLGLDAYGGMGAPSSNIHGIMITNGSGGHTIGSLSGTSRSNVIANSEGAGVWITDTAGSGTVVRPNSIYANGKSGLGLAIDLGVLGPRENDALDPDSGPNAYQNAPIVNGSVPNADTTRQVSGRLNSVAGRKYRVDIYRSTTCAGGDRGGDAQTRVGSVDVLTGTLDNAGKATFSLPVSGSGAPISYLTAIATDTSSSNTSEIGVCFFEDTIFKDGAEGGF